MDSDVEARFVALETRLQLVADDAAAARHLAAARNADLADVAIAVNAGRQTLNALSLQAAERVGQVDGRFDGIDTRLGHIEARLDGIDGRMDRMESQAAGGFTAVRGAMDQSAAGQAQIVRLLESLGAHDDDG